MRAYATGWSEESRPFVEEIQFYRDLIGLDHLTIFPHMLGDSYAKANEQMTRFAEEVLPLVT